MYLTHNPAPVSVIVLLNIFLNYQFFIVNYINQTPPTSTSITNTQTVPEDVFKNNLTSQKRYANSEFEDQWAKLEGRRIIDLKYIFKSIHYIHNLNGIKLYCCIIKTDVPNE